MRREANYQSNDVNVGKRLQHEILCLDQGLNIYKYFEIKYFIFHLGENFKWTIDDEIVGGVVLENLDQIKNVASGVECRPVQEWVSKIDRLNVLRKLI